MEQDIVEQLPLSGRRFFLVPRLGPVKPGNLRCQECRQCGSNTRRYMDILQNPKEYRIVVLCLEHKKRYPTFTGLYESRH